MLLLLDRARRLRFGQTLGCNRMRALIYAPAATLLSAQTGRSLLPAKTKICSRNCRSGQPWHVICSPWTEFAKADQGGSRSNLRFTQQIGEGQPVALRNSS